jgi:hypothetical protein
MADTEPTIREIPDITRLQKVVMEYMRQVVSDDYVDEDLSHYIFEEAMMAFYGRDVWKYINKRL